MDNNLYRRMLAQLSNKEPLYQMLASDMYEAVMENFSQEGRTRWIQLAASTIKQRQRKGYWPGKILQRRGGAEGLLGSIFWAYNNDMAMVATNKIYAAIHQYGGTITHTAKPRNIPTKNNRFISNKKAASQKRGAIDYIRHPGGSWTINIPARPFMLLTDQDKESMKSSILSYLTQN